MINLATSGLNPCCNGRWSRTKHSRALTPRIGEVLILVVMEDGLVLMSLKQFMHVVYVLILVVMEDGLVHY